MELVFLLGNFPMDICSSAVGELRGQDGKVGPESLSKQYFC